MYKVAVAADTAFTLACTERVAAEGKAVAARPQVRAATRSCRQAGQLLRAYGAAEQPALVFTRYAYFDGYRLARQRKGLLAMVFGRVGLPPWPAADPVVVTPHAARLPAPGEYIQRRSVAVCRAAKAASRSVI